MPRRPALLFVAAAALLASLAGCSFATTSDAMQSWVGNTQHDLILKWGPPTRTASDGAGGVVFYTAPQSTQRTATRMFYVNREGVIYSWRWQD
jgi:hypothetical protein